MVRSSGLLLLRSPWVGIVHVIFRYSSMRSKLISTDTTDAMAFGFRLSYTSSFMSYSLFLLRGKLAMEHKKRSEVWTYFEQIPNSKAKCNFCSQILSYKGGSTYNLSRHLKSKHPSSSCVLVDKQASGNSKNIPTPAEAVTNSQFQEIKDIPSSSKSQDLPPAKNKGFFFYQTNNK